MKENVPYPVDFKDDAAFNKWANSGEVAISDNNNTYEALVDIDRLLAKHGLEIICWDAGSSDYWYSIKERK